MMLGQLGKPRSDARPKSNQSGKRDLNPRLPRWQRGALPLSYSRVESIPIEHVREKGLEPSYLAAPDPKSGVSASSTTLAGISNVPTVSLRLAAHRIQAAEKIV